MGDAPLDEPAPGHLVAGRYRLRSSLGRGAMGAVWLATDETLHRDVAIKQLHSTAALAPEVAEERRQRALREGRIAARLRNEHAIAMIDVAVHAGDPWLVMEYLPSRDLAAVVVSAHVLPVLQVAQIGAQVADAMAEAHAVGIVHRDIKPANVLVGEGGDVEGLVKIADFGIARARDEVSITGAGLISGTPAYFAPEVARGEEPTPASDVHALGATLFAALEGTPPYGLDDNAIALLHRIATGDHLAPTRAGAVEPVLLAMLDPDPAGRPTMGEVRDVLAQIAAGTDRRPEDVLAARTTLTPVTFAAAGIAVGVAAVGGFLAGAMGGGGADAVGGAAAGAGGAAAGAGGAAGVAGPAAGAGGVAASGGEAATVALAVPAVAKVGGLGGLLAQPVALAAGVGAVVLAAGVTYVVATSSSSSPVAAPTTTVTSSAAPTTTALTATESEQAVRELVALLPGDPAGALALAGPTLQAVGVTALRDYLADVDTVELRSVSAQDGGSVTAELVLTLGDGSTRTEPVTFTVTRPGTSPTPSTSASATSAPSSSARPSTSSSTTAVPSSGATTSSGASGLLVESDQLAALVRAGVPTTSATTTRPTTATTAPSGTTTTTAASTTTTSGAAATTSTAVSPSELPSSTGTTTVTVPTTP